MIWETLSGSLADMISTCELYGLDNLEEGETISPDLTVLFSSMAFLFVVFLSNDSLYSYLFPYSITNHVYDAKKKKVLVDTGEKLC